MVHREKDLKLLTCNLHAHAQMGFCGCIRPDFGRLRGQGETVERRQPPHHVQLGLAKRCANSNIRHIAGL